MLFNINFGFPGMMLEDVQSMWPRLKSPLTIMIDFEFGLSRLSDWFSFSSDTSSFGCGR